MTCLHDLLCFAIYLIMVSHIQKYNAVAYNHIDNNMRINVNPSLLLQTIAFGLTYIRVI